MGKYVLTYPAGNEMPESEEAVAEVMAAWNGWFASLGDAVVDGGAPFGQGATLTASGTTRHVGGSTLGGYSILQADDLEHAATLAAGCPVHHGGGDIAIHEIVDM